MDEKDKDYAKPIRFPDDCGKGRKNFTQGYFYREIGHYNNAVPSEFQWAAEDKLINKAHFEEVKCQLPDSPRSTFLMVFSPDGKKVASTHGNHNVYVTDLTTGKNIQTLSGHPRTPWCIAFHPSSNQILASGCLGGQVRVWDLQGRSEVWTAESQTVIASLAFHPVDRMLVIATYNELHFWDWSQPEPFAKCSTKSEREKVRYVSFDRLGNKLITGIANPVNTPSQWDRINVINSVNNQSSSVTSTTSTSSFSSTPTTSVANTQAPSDQGRSITFCYRHLMNQYNQLVTRYLDLSRSRITPTTDRGTDPMDLLDFRNNGTNSESNLSNPTPSTSNTQPNSQANSSSSSSPLRFKISGSGSRSLSNRRKFQFLSSLYDRLYSRQPTTASSSVALTTSVSSSTQQTIFTNPSLLNSPSTSSQQSSPRMRRCALSLGSTARSWCLTFGPENSSNLFSSRNTTQSSSFSRAVTNPTYTSYSDRSIFSTRESGSTQSERSQYSVVCPYRMLLDELDDHRLTIHRAVQPSENSTTPNSGEVPDSNNDATESNELRSTRNRSSYGHDRNYQRSPELNFRRFRNDSRNLRHPHEHQSQLRLITNRETHGLNLQNNQNLRRQLSFRPGGQFVLSRHLNSPFQPRVSHQVNVATTTDGNLSTNDNSSRNNSPRNNSGPVPEIPSKRSSFASSSALNSTGSSSSSSSPSFQGSSSSSSSSSSSNGSSINFLPGESSSRQLREQIKTRLFDRVEMMLRDRMRNSSDVPSVDSTVNYSQISGETEEANVSRGLGPRGADPMLSSASDNRDMSSEGLFLQETSPTDPLNNPSEIGSGQQTESEILDLWESETEASPFSLPLSDLLDEQLQTNREQYSERNTEETDEDPETLTVNSPADNSNMSAAEYNMREGIQRLSLHIEGMQVLCRARIEILQREKIRGMWENLTNQIRQFQQAIQSRTESEGNNSSAANPNSDSSNSSTDLPSLRDLAISSSPLSDFPRPSTSSNYNSVINGYKELLESMVNELLNEIKRSRKPDRESSSGAGPSSAVAPTEPNTSSTSEVPERNETEEPQPGPSGLSDLPTASEIIENIKRNLDVKFLIEMFKRERRRRPLRTGASSGSGGGHFSGSVPRSNHYLGLRHSSRDFRRNKRIPDYFSSNSRAIKRRLDDILKSRRGEQQPSVSSATNNSSQSSVSNVGESSSSGEACQSCGQKKKPVPEGTNTSSQKRRSADSEENVEASSSASKILKSNTGERSRVSGEDEATPSTSSASEEPSTSQSQRSKSTNELLNQMIQTMVTMLRFLREAFSRTDEQTESQSARQQQQRPRRQRQEEQAGALASSGDDSDDNNNGNLDNNEQMLRDLPGDFRRTKEIIADLMRDVTQLRAQKLLGFAVKCLTQFFGKNFGSLIQVLDEQFLSLYKLLHLAMELTDLLLRQLNSRSRDLERSLEVDSLDVRNPETRSRNLLLSRSNDSFSRRDRFRNLGRNSHGQSFGTSRDDLMRTTAMRSTTFLPSNSRLSSSRLGASGSSPGIVYDRSSTFLSNYARRRRRRTARMSTSLPSGWAGRRVVGASPTHSPTQAASIGRDVSLNGNSVSSLRSFRFDRRTNEEPDTYSDIRSFNYDNNNYNTDNRNNNNSNDSNNNYDSNGLGYFNNSRNNNSSGNRNSVNNNDNSGSSNFFNHYFQSNSTNSNADSSNNNIIIVTGLSSDNDVVNNSGNSTRNNNNNNNNNTEGTASTRSSGVSFVGQNPLTPLRSMELTLSRNDGNDLSLRDERPIFWIRYGGSNESSGSSNGSDSQSRVSTFTVPVVQVNDVPVSDVSMLNQPRHRPQSPVPRGPEDIWRWRAWRPRLLHPRNPFEDQDSNDVPENIHYYRILSTSAGSHLGVYTLDPIITDAPLSPRHRIQAWDFSKMNIPDISDRDANGVVPECKIHNDASVDVSNDGHLLVTLLPAGRLSVTTMLGVYSLDWSSLGQLLYRTSFEQNAVSVSLSPTNRHLLVGLASRPVVVRDRTNMAQIFRLEGGRPSPNGGSWQSGRGRLVHMRDLEQTRETNVMSLNCIRWAPGAGQGLVYGTNTGLLKVLR